MCQHPLCGQAIPDQTPAGHSLLYCTHGKYRATSLDFGKGWNSFNWCKPEHSRSTNSGFVWKKKNDPSLYTRWFMHVWKSVLYTQWFMCTWKSIRFSFCSCLISIPNPTHWSQNLKKKKIKKSFQHCCQTFSSFETQMWNTLILLSWAGMWQNSIPSERREAGREGRRELTADKIDS